MSGDRWVVRYPNGQWGVERSSRRMSSQLFPSLEDALTTARAEAVAAGGGDLLVQTADGLLCLREQIPGGPQAHRRPQVSPRDGFSWTVLA